MYQRIITKTVKNMLAEASIVLIQGPRQAGKSSLVKEICQADPKYEYRSLDIASDYEFAKSNPGNFLRRKNHLIIDEVLKVPELISEIKSCVNEDPLPGKFILTSSTNISTFPNLREQLVSRMKTITMPPLAQCEIQGIAPNFLQHLINGSFNENSDEIDQSELIQTMLIGGYPESILRTNDNRRQSWFSSYLQSIYYQNGNNSSGDKSRSPLSQFVKNLTNYSGQLLDQFNIHETLNVNFETCQRYLNFLERSFLISRIKSWPPHSIKQEREPIKLQFIDSGLFTSLKSPQVSIFEQNQTNFAGLLNCFISSEILKLTNIPEHEFEIYYFRSSGDEKVDIVLVRDDGLIAGVDILPKDSISPIDLNGLYALMLKCGQRFSYGAVLYSGRSVQKLDEKIFAIPISSLWSS